jgi:asparagine synthetase B (glutamine-hydrolysing)
MSGIFGVCCNGGLHDCKKIARDVERYLMHQDWYSHVIVDHKNLSIGAVSTSPYFSYENNYYENDKLILLIEGNGVTIEGGCAFNESIPVASNIASLYLKYGKNIITKIQGSYNLFIHDKNNRQIIICNDRFGFSYLYYYKDNDVFIFGPETKILLAYDKFDRALDEEAVASYFISNVILGNSSIFKNSKLLPNASVLSIIDNKLSIEQYWRPVCIRNNNKTELDFINQANELYKASLQKKIPQDKSDKIIMPLTGGLDSRLLLNILQKLNNNLQIYTHGNKKCIDYKIASKVIKELGFEKSYQLVDISPECMGPTNAIKSVWLSECNVDVRPTHLIQVANALNPGRVTFINGIIGAHMSMGSDHVFSSKEIVKSDDKAFITNSLERLFGLSQASGRLKNILQDEVADEFLSIHRKNVLNNYEQYRNNELFCDQKDMFAQFTFGRRMMGNIDLNKFFFHDVLPFVDSDLFDLYAEIPPHLKMNHYLYKELLKVKYPKMASIPWATTGVDLNSKYKINLVRKIEKLKYKSQHYIRRLTHGYVDLNDNSQYVSREKWLRRNRDFRQMVMNSIQYANDNNIPYVAGNKLLDLIKLHDAGRNYLFISIIRAFTFIVWYRLFCLNEYRNINDVEHWS